MKQIYLKISESRSTIIDRALNDKASSAWKQLQIESQPWRIYHTNDGEVLLKLIRDEVKELGLSHLKIYGEKALVIYSSNEEEIGSHDSSIGFEAAYQGNNSLIEKKTSSGTLYELYIKVPSNTYGTVMELYEPVDYLNKITNSLVIPLVAFSFAMLFILGWLMKKLVFRAQKDIDYRTQLIFDYRDRLQQLVSKEAANTLRSSVGNSLVIPKRVKVTILFTDIRGFTDYCEHESPETIISFLNQILGITIQTIEKHQGDIDKLIGDSVLAFFQGEDAEISALTAAQEVLNNLHQENFPRGVGIGIYTGNAVIGTIGADNRKDFTVIGDTVNVASRLCSAAKENEIVIDAASCEAAHIEDMKTEKLSVKGKKKQVEVCRIVFKT